MPIVTATSLSVRPISQGSVSMKTTKMTAPMTFSQRALRRANIGDALANLAAIHRP